MKPGDTMTDQPLHAHVPRLVPAPGAEPHEARARFAVSRGGTRSASTRPARTRTRRSSRPRTRSAIRTDWLRAQDLFIIANDFRGGKVAVKVLVHPLVNLIWLGGLVFLLGSLITLWPDRREQRRLARRGAAGSGDVSCRSSTAPRSSRTAGGTMLIFRGASGCRDFASCALLDDAAGSEALRAVSRPFPAIGPSTASASCSTRRPGGRARTGLRGSATRGPARRSSPPRRRAAHRATGRDEPLSAAADQRLHPGRAATATSSASRGRRPKRSATALPGRGFADPARSAVSALTLTYADEAVGIVRACRAGLPVVVSFTVDRRRLPSGQPSARRSSASTPRLRRCYPRHALWRPRDALHRRARGERPWIGRLRGSRATHPA